MIIALILLIILPIFGLCFFHWNIRGGRKGKLIAKIPGPPAIPLLGNTLNFMGPLGKKFI